MNSTILLIGRDGTLNPTNQTVPSEHPRRWVTAKIDLKDYLPRDPTTLSAPPKWMRETEYFYVGTAGPYVVYAERG